jgi:2'-hydroxyisoflavone reductase
MRILFIGGTRFVGRAIVDAAVTAGHDVTVLHRGTTGTEGLEGVTRLRADRDKDLSVLDGLDFDATVDVCAYVPRQVEQLADALGGRGGHHVFISTMSVYADTDKPGLTEDAPLTQTPDPGVEEVTNETYGGLKVLCERAAVAAYGEDNLTVVRPTFVVGPNDYTFRFPRWVRRIADGGEVLAPGPATSPVQVVDARDQGAWTVRLAEARTAGVFNGVGTGLPFGFEDMLEAIRTAVAPEGTTLTWVDGAWLREQGVDGADLPLWAEGEDEWTLAGSNARALASGLAPRPLTDTVRDTLAWLESTGAQPANGWGLAPEREAELLAAWATRDAGPR